MFPKIFLSKQTSFNEIPNDLSLEPYALLDYNIKWQFSPTFMHIHFSQHKVLLAASFTFD